MVISNRKDVILIFFVKIFEFLMLIWRFILPIFAFLVNLFKNFGTILKYAFDVISLITVVKTLLKPNKESSMIGKKEIDYANEWGNAGKLVKNIIGAIAKKEDYAPALADLVTVIGNISEFKTEIESSVGIATGSFAYEAMQTIDMMKKIAAAAPVAPAA
jgi:hypothetical protein